MILWFMFANTGCVSLPSPLSVEPGQDTSGMGTLQHLGQQMTDTMLQQASNTSVNPSLQIDQESPIQMTQFTNMDGSNAGARFGTMISEHMAQRFAQQGYIIKRTQSPDTLLQSTFAPGSNLSQ